VPKIFRRRFLCASGALLAAPLAALAQPARLYRIGVIYHGGLYASAVDGLRDGLKKEGFEEGKQFVFHLRDIKGDLKAVDAVARGLEGEKVDLICSLTTSITIGVKRTTTSVPIVFYAGVDPVAAGLIEQFRKPGGRITGLYSRNTDLVPKRLELLTQLAPKTRRILVFYNPDNPIAQRSLNNARVAVERLKLELVERQVHSVEEFRAALSSVRRAEGDAIGYLTDAMIISEALFVAETANAKKMPTIFSDASVVAKGGLASYGEGYYAAGRRLASLVHRVLLGANPGDLPVEQLDAMHFAINLKTAKAIGLNIPSSLLQRADEVIR
jgi:putative ABC transport system substrate-binding protein